MFPKRYTLNILITFIAFMVSGVVCAQKKLDYFGGELQSGSYILSNNIAPYMPYNIPAGYNVVINLNGHTLDGEGTMRLFVLNPNSTLTITGNGTIKRGNAGNNNNGGAIFSNGGTLIIEGNGNLVLEKSKALNGGAIYMEGGGECIIKNCIIRDNYAQVNGGGIFTAVKTTVSGSKILNNRAMSSITPSTALGDQKGRGGGFCFAGAKAELINTLVQGNAAMMYGGGGQIESHGTLTLNDGCEIIHNTSIIGGAAGLHVTANAIFNMEGGVIGDNEALGGVGGGIHSSYGCQLNLNSGTIRNNKVWGRAGGINVNTGVHLVLNGTNIINNSAYKGQDLNSCSVVAKSDGTYSWSTPEGTDNEHTGYGGGVTVDCGTCTMNAGELSGNYAQLAGGGLSLVMLYIQPAFFHRVEVSKFVLNRGTINGNTTDGNGAGIYFMRNMAPENWSAFAQDEKDELTSTYPAKVNTILNATPQIVLKEGSFDKNIAQENGGAIYMEAGTFVVDSTSTVNLFNNKSVNANGGCIYQGGGSFAVNAEATMNVGTEATPNTAQNGSGGGIFCAGFFTVNGNINVNGNKALNGGGVCVKNGAVTIANGLIQGNIATQMGGGLYVFNDEAEEKEALFSGGTFSNNRAIFGGGACMNGKIALSMAATFEDNEAYNGGAIYMLNGANMTFGAGLLRYNSAVYDYGTGTTPSTALGASHAVADNPIYGVGGGIFMDLNTKLAFSEPNKLGIYDNTASFAADDIYANGNETYITLPITSTMELSGFKGSKDLYWVEDYPTGDTNYPDNTSILAGARPYSAMRYDKALESDGTLGILKKDVAHTLTDYACITLGYDMVFVNLVKNGLLPNDDVTFVFYMVNNPESATPTYIEHCRIILTGENSKDVHKVVALPSGYWRIEEGWGWKYNEPTLYQGTTAADAIDSNKLDPKKIRINQNSKDIYIKNTVKDTPKIKSYDTRKRNLMRPAS